MAAFLGLTACTAPSGLRDTGTPITATTRFDAAQMQGEWVVRERFALAGDELDANPERFEFGVPEGQRFAVTWDHLNCNSWECVDVTEDLTATVTGPGRYRLARGALGEADHWVIWTDAGFRVAAIGTPSGAFGWIMTRGPVREDVMQAAREIMEWNGYDLSLLVSVSP